jgi:hypothetical protein
MEKRDYIWVAIRIFGIYLLVQALISLLAVAHASLQVYAQGVNMSLNEAIAVLHSQLRTTATATLVYELMAVLVYGAVGGYMTFRGKLLFRWICSPDEPRSHEMPLRPGGVGGSDAPVS